MKCYLVLVLSNLEDIFKESTTGVIFLRLRSVKTKPAAEFYFSETTNFSICFATSEHTPVKFFLSDPTKTVFRFSINLTLTQRRQRRSIELLF